MTPNATQNWRLLEGMRQRIKVAQGIVHDPQVFVLDEPLNGLDPVARREMTHLLNTLAARGKCILISSHILYEVEQLTSNILMMSRGRVMAQGNIYQIRNLIDRYPHRISIKSPQARALAASLLGLPYVLSAKLDAANATQVEIETHQPEMFYTQFPELVLRNEYDILSFDSPDNNLESVFKYLVS